MHLPLKIIWIHAPALFYLIFVSFMCANLFIGSLPQWDIRWEQDPQEGGGGGVAGGGTLITQCENKNGNVKTWWWSEDPLIDCDASKCEWRLAVSYNSATKIAAFDFQLACLNTVTLGR